MDLKAEILKVARTGLAFTPAGLLELHSGLASHREIADACSELLAQGKLDPIKPGFVGIQQVIHGVNKDVNHILDYRLSKKLHDLDRPHVVKVKPSLTPCPPATD